MTLASRFVLKALDRLSVGCLTMRLPDGSTRVFGGEGSSPSVEQERTLLHLRNLLGIRLLESRAGDGGFPEPDYAALPSNGSLLPEIEPGALTPELLRAAILRNGCVLVRGLLDRAEAEELARKIDKMLMDDPPQLNFYNGAFVEAVSDRVKGYVQSFTGRRPNLRNVTLA